ncbi:MAG: hypothetical protein V1773_14860 [bacterium]
MKKVILILFFIAGGLFAQETNPQKILDKVKERFNVVKDYQVDLKIKLDVSFLKMPESKAKVYFKQPDKFKFDSEGFAMLPKEGLNYNPAKFLTDDFTSVYVKLDDLDGKKVHIIKILPNSDSSEVILTTLYVDAEKYVLNKIETNTKRGGAIKIDLKYDDGIKYPLPKQVKFNFNMAGMNMSGHMPGKMDDPDDAAKKSKSKDGISGDVYLYYSNYKINKGIADSFFEKKKERK